MEERLQFLASGAKPKKNTEAMKEVIEELKREGLFYDGSAAGKTNGTKKDKKKDKKKPVDSDDEEEAESSEEDKKKKKKDKKAKKDKKRKHRDSDDESEDEEIEKPKKKKQKLWIPPRLWSLLSIIVIKCVYEGVRVFSDAIYDYEDLI